MDTARQVTPDIYVLPSEFPAPGMGTLPVNAYVIKSSEPVLVDTGLHQDVDGFQRALESVIDPEEIKWLYLTHPDQDHVGSLSATMTRATQARLVTTYFGLGILSLSMQVPLDRVYFLNPGDRLDIGDRSISVVRPPTFDNPATTAFIESKSGALFSSDCFGALLPETAEWATDIDQETLRQAQVLWATMDTPWIHRVDRSRFAEELNQVRQMQPELVLSAHLPPAKAITDWLLGSLAATPDSPEFVGPNQAALQAMLAEMTGAPASASV
jgi:flavorubredoxin